MSEFQFITIEGHQALTSEMAFELYELDRQFFPTPWSEESWKSLFIEHDRLLTIVKTNEAVIGFCLFDKSLADAFAHLLKILIRPEFRANGLSKTLLEASLLNLKVLGCSQFFLEVEENNIAAQSLYLSKGFKVIHKKKDFYGKDRSALIMTM